MKRLLIAAMVLALVGAFAFADGATIKWSANTYTGFGLASQGSVNTFEGYDYSWVGGGAVRFGAALTSADGNAGFNSRLQMPMPTLAPGPGNTTGAPVAAFNQLNGWGKLFGGMLTVRGGILDDYTVATPIWNNYGRTDGLVGISADLAPIAGLDIVFFQQIPAAGDTSGNLLNSNGQVLATSTVNNRDILGVAYAAKDIGKVELGALLSGVANGTSLYLGGNISAIKGLTLQLEAIGNLASTFTFTALENVSYAMGALTVGTYVGETSDGTTFNWGLEPTASYKVTDNFSVNAIINVYSTAGQTWMSPIDAGSFGTLAANVTSFAGGVSVGFTASGMTFTVGDYYAAQSGAGNLLYANVDVAL